MKLSINQVLKTIDGEVIGGDKSFTVKKAIVESLTANYQGEEVSQSEKMTRWVLAKKVHSAKDLVELTLEEATKIKEVVFKGYSVLIAGQIADLLEGDK